MGALDAYDSIHTAPPAEPGGDDATVEPEDSRITLAPIHTERVIPLRTFDLRRLLLADPRLDAAGRDAYDRAFRLLASVLHHEYLEQLTELKELYAPLDPDSDCVTLKGFSRNGSASADEAFFAPFEELVLRANYRPLDLEYLKEAVSAPNELGLNYVPNFDLFEHLRVWVRGHGEVVRSRRSWRTRFRKRPVVQPAYQRMVVALKFKPGKHLGDFARADVVYLRMFKDVPHVDMEMHLPEQGTKVKMRIIDKAQIASPVAVGLPGLVVKLMGLSLLSLSTVGLGTLMVAPISAGLNSFFGFQRAKQRHLHYMIRHLYYLTLANNASVVTRLVDMAEEEEFKEAALAYFLLGRPHPEGTWTASRLDQATEVFLRERLGVGVDFEIGDALDKLFRLDLVRAEPDGGLIAVPPDEALVTLDRRWDDYYRLGPARTPAEGC